MTSRVSIIIPVYNAAVELGRCLESLEQQNYHNFEVLILDGQSSDGTDEVVAYYKKKTGMGVHYFAEPDNGVYDAMNKGVTLARGEWVFFLGADDRLKDEKVLTDVANVMKEKHYDIIYGDVLFISGQKRYGGECSLDRLLFSENLCQQSIFYHRSVFDKLGYFNTRYPIWADWEFNIRCFRHTNLQKKWIDRIVAIYNDISGISNEEDPVFKKELPVMLLKEIAKQRSITAVLQNKRSYFFGKKLFGWLD